MPLDPTNMSAAKVIISGLPNREAVAEFQTQANASSIPWWTAEREQRNELGKLADAKPWKSTPAPTDPNQDVGKWVRQYCTAVSANSANPWINNNIPAQKGNRGHWLKYYLTECALMSTIPQAVGDTLGALLVNKPKGGLSLKYANLEAIDPAKFKGILLGLLKAGFDWIPGTETQYLGRDTSNTHLMAFLRQTGAAEKYTYCWRSDARPYAKIEDDEGFLAKGRSKKEAREHGMTEVWHPFSDPTIKSYQWFRKGQKDNCLYSVVSIGTGTDWKTFLPFPLLRDHKSWAVDDQEVPCKIAGKWGKAKLGVSASWLYLFVLSDLILADTQRIEEFMGASGYPELGVPVIPLENIFGAIRFIRIHHADKARADDKMGFTAFAVDCVLTNKHVFTIKERWGDGYTKLKEAFFEAYQSDYVHLHWTPSGHVDLPSKFTLDGKEIELGATSFAAMKAHKFGAEK